MTNPTPGLRPSRMLLRVHEAADLLGLSRAMMYQMLAAGQLPVVRIGRSVRVPVTELQQWVERQTAEWQDAHTPDLRQQEVMKKHPT